MRLTAEIRWFWPDRPPQQFHGWFVGAGAAWTAAGSTKTRVDQYLRDPDQDSLGIKKRGRGDVEIKGLISRRDKHLDFAGCTSPIELWAKWASRTLDLDGPAIHTRGKEALEASFSVHAGAISELATSSEPVSSPIGIRCRAHVAQGARYGNLVDPGF